MDVALRFSVLHIDFLRTCHFDIPCMHHFVKDEISLDSTVRRVSAMVAWVSGSILSRANLNLLNW